MSLEEVSEGTLIYVMLMTLIDEMGGVVALPISEMNKVAKSAKGLYVSASDDKYYIEVKEFEDKSEKTN